MEVKVGKRVGRLEQRVHPREQLVAGPASQYSPSVPRRRSRFRAALNSSEPATSVRMDMDSENGDVPAHPVPARAREQRAP